MEWLVDVNSAHVAQGTEHRVSNPTVIGSNPIVGTKNKNMFKIELTINGEKQKTKFYQSRQRYNAWVLNHKDRGGYNFYGFEYKKNKWARIHAFNEN